MADQGYTAEPSGCAPRTYGPLDMEDGLRYFVSLSVPNKDADMENVRASIYPGNNTAHWANSVFWECRGGASDGTAVFRITRFFYVIHRQLADAVDIQLHAVDLPESEVDKLLVLQHD